MVEKVKIINNKITLVPQNNNLWYKSKKILIQY